MKCSKCESIIEVNSKFCSSCGTKSQPEKKSNNRYIGFFVLFVLFTYFMSDSGYNFEGQTLVGGDTMYTSSSLNVRSKPSIKGEKIITLSINTKIITSKENNNGWVFIGDMDSVGLGFVSSSYLQEKSYSKYELEEIQFQKNVEASRKKQTTPSSSSEDLLAYNYAEGFVKQRLKSPGSAKFPGIWDGKRDHVTKLGNREYRINSYVDSQNGFGAMLRTNWSCIIFFKGDNVGYRELEIY
jgi:uncharacterized protein YgiM (DUF1202 family)